MHAGRVLFRKIKREDLIEDVDRKNPPEEIAVGHAEIAAAILPDPLFAENNGIDFHLHPERGKQGFFRLARISLPVPQDEKRALLQIDLYSMKRSCSQ
jgi:hypothetical protein